LLATTASVFILGLGIIAALNQVGIATAVTTPVLIAVLATIAGIFIVGVGGGLVRPMQERWERWLTNAEVEAPRVRRQVQGSGSYTSSTITSPYPSGYPDSPPPTGGATQVQPPTVGDHRGASGR
jgi:hypothetical protein